MPRMLDVSQDVRAEIGDDEADRLLVGDTTPGSYDCTSCRTPGDSDQERTSTVLFIGDETAVLAFAHATCIPSQVVRVAEDQLQGAVRSITGSEQKDTEGLMPEQAVLGITSGLVLIEDDLRPALVVEPTGPGSPGPAPTAAGRRVPPAAAGAGLPSRPRHEPAAGGPPRLVRAAGGGSAARRAAAERRRRQSGRLVAGPPAAPGHRGLAGCGQQVADGPRLRGSRPARSASSHARTCSGTPWRRPRSTGSWSPPRCRWPEPDHVGPAGPPPPNSVFSGGAASDGP